MSPPPSFEKPFFAGIDVGGTSVKIGLVDNRGAIVGESKFATQPSRSPDLAVVEMQRNLVQLCDNNSVEWSDIVAAGIGTPGPMNIKSGTILTPTNLPGWRDYPIRERVGQALGLPVTYTNDAGAAAFAENWVGGGRDFKSIVMLTLGTGVGGGIIIDDRSIDGENSHGAELGHMTIQTGPDARMCGCGQRGHLEAYASATALVQRTSEELNSSGHVESSLRQNVIDSIPLTALMISEAAQEGDRLAVEMISQTARYLALGIAQLAHVIDPSAFILGGAMSFGGDESALGRSFLQTVIDEASKLIFPVLASRLVVRFAQLGSHAGLVGAAGLARIDFLETSPLKIITVQ